MTVRTWDGSSNRFDSAADWSPAGVPQPGDIALIDSGTVTAAGAALRDLGIASTGAFNLGDGTTLAPDTQLTVSGAGALNAAGQVVNQGVITLKGPAGGLLSAGPAGTAGVLRNTGTINLVNEPALFAAAGLAPSGSVENDGVVSIWTSSPQAQDVGLDSLAGGVGTVQLFEGTQARTLATGAGQTFRFIAGAGRASFLTLNAPGAFGGRIAGFAAPDTIGLSNVSFTSYAYAGTGPASGVLTLSSGGTTVASVAFDGTYRQSDFTLATRPLGGASTRTDITTTAAPPPQDIELQDATLGLASLDASDAYAGPVSGVQHQYTWAGNDQAGIAALSPNAFLKGGPGNDALLATGGSNVLDGGGGSNFLAGATGTDGGRDTFFVDGRAGPAWDTILGFHPGDAVALFGFQAGQGTFSWTASDGAPSFQGATLRAGLGGLGGADVSVTFARVGLDDAQGRFTLSTGSTGGVGYLYVAYA